MMIIIWIKTRKTILLVCASYWQRDLANKYPSKHFWYLLNSNPVPNWVFSLNLHEILFWSILALKFCSKYIGLLGFFYFRWFIYLSFRGVNKGQNLFEELYPCPLNPPSPRLYYVSIVELTKPWDAHLHFTAIFENSILVQKSNIT